MIRALIPLALCAAFGLASSGCDDPNGSSLTGGASRSPSPSPQGAADVPVADPAKDSVSAAQVRAIGSPEVNSRQHGCGKMSVASLGAFLSSRGIGGKGARPDKTAGGPDIFGAGDTAAALGAPNYAGRVAEAPFASTSAISKMFDIYTMSSYDLVAADWSAPACPGVQLIAAGQFTKDGISCLIGKPATDEHVAIANQAIADNPTDGPKLAAGALLAAAHTCQ